MGLGRPERYERQRSGPERLGERLDARSGRRVRVPERKRSGNGRDMKDQRIVRRPPLGGEDALHSALVEAIGAEAVDRFCRKSDMLAGAQKQRRARKIGGRVAAEYLGQGVAQCLCRRTGSVRIPRMKFDFNRVSGATHSTM